MAERPSRCGVALMALADLPDPGAHSVVVGSGTARLDILLVRSGAAVRAFVNSCPHQGTPLDTFKDRFFDTEARHLVCSTHGARFRAADGMCVHGPCAGQRLAPLTIGIEAGTIRLLEDPEKRM